MRPLPWLIPKVAIVSTKPKLREHPRRRRRQQHVADEADHVREQDRVPERGEVLVPAQVDPEQREAEDRELASSSTSMRRASSSRCELADDPLQGQLEEPVHVLLEVDDVEPVGERLRRIAVGQAAGELVDEQEAEPDDELAEEVLPAPRQIAAADASDSRHGGDSNLRGQISGE